MSQSQKKAMISSTSLDLPEHRKEAMDACLRQSVFPEAMEHLPASDADAIRVSLAMVDEADIYIGIFAWRYGYVPKGCDISVTEMEFNRAVERKIPILVFTIHKDHALTIEMVEADKSAQEKLRQLKERACDGRGRLEFKSPVELRSHIIQSLSKLLAEMEVAEDGKPKAINFHPPNLIPSAPAPYIAHPYSLLQTSEVVGRRDELKLLTDWVTTNKEIPAGIRLFNVVAIGGMGKSALTWKWFNDIAPNELPYLKGRMWWSFYESDAYFENFVIRALAYTAGMTEAVVRELPAHEREDQLFHLLDAQPFLLVLDGLERILLAYSRMDAAHLSDDDLDEKTANDIAQYYGLPDEVKETYLEKHRLRQCSDPRAGRFLRRLAQVNASRILISTRLYPAELQTTTAQPLPSCQPLFLKGLSDDDALALWRAFIGGERSGTSERLLPYFRAFGNYPLLLRALAGEVAEYKPAPGDFDRWLQDHPDFNPAQLDLRNARTHILKYALEGLHDAHIRTLHTLAAFRMPATWETLCAVLVGKGKKKPCRDQGTLVAVLTELEDRGLVGWDKRANRYHLHPIVRGVAIGALNNQTKKYLFGELYTYFEAVPKPDWYDVESLDDLTPAIELYYSLLELERFDEAAHVFFNLIDAATHNRLSTSRKRIELLSPLVESTAEEIPRIQDPNYLVATLNALGRAYNYEGNTYLAAKHLNYAIDLQEISPLLSSSNAFCLCDLSNVMRPAGHLFRSLVLASKAIALRRKDKRFHQEMRSSVRLGLTLAACGQSINAEIVLRRAMQLAKVNLSIQGKGFVSSAIAQMQIWHGQNHLAQVSGASAWTFAQNSKFERDLIRAIRLQGEAIVKIGNSTAADEHLHSALTRARAVNLVEEELPALIALAELRRRQDKPHEARELLDAVWDAAERGPYPLFHADALNMLAQLERDAGNISAAIEPATKAYCLAWCDGPPYAYHWGLEAARQHLQALGAPKPELPPFDPSKFEPMPEVEINPEDEFHVGNIDNE